jgi:hypothetical protein
MSEANGQDRGRPTPVSVEGVGMLVAFLDTHRVERRRPHALRRLAELQASEEFGSLPDDLRLRIHELVAESEHR